MARNFLILGLAHSTSPPSTKMAMSLSDFAVLVSILGNRQLVCFTDSIRDFAFAVSLLISHINEVRASDEKNTALINRTHSMQNQCNKLILDINKVVETFIDDLPYSRANFFIVQALEFLLCRKKGASLIVWSITRDAPEHSASNAKN